MLVAGVPYTSKILFEVVPLSSVGRIFKGEPATITISCNNPWIFVPVRYVPAVVRFFNKLSFHVKALNTSSPPPPPKAGFWKQIPPPPSPSPRLHFVERLKALAREEMKRRREALVQREEETRFGGVRFFFKRELVGG